MNCTIFECTDDLEERVQHLGTYLEKSRDDDFQLSNFKEVYLTAHIKMANFTSKGSVCVGPM